MSPGDPGWDIRTSGPEQATATVLCLPGGLCTTAFYEDLMAEPALAGVRMVAATLPGQGGAAPLDDPSIENCVRLAAGLARDHGCDAVIGHSLGANVALEMAASAGFSGPLVLLSPSLSRTDESRFLRILDRLAVALGRLPFVAALHLIGPALKGALPADRHAALTAELRKSDPDDVRRSVRPYLRYLDEHGTLAPRLCAAGVQAWVVYGENDDVGITDDERRVLEQCPNTTVVTIAGAGHFTLNQEPAQVADLLVEALGANHHPR